MRTVAANAVAAGNAKENPGPNAVEALRKMIVNLKA